MLFKETYFLLKDLSLEGVKYLLSSPLLAVEDKDLIAAQGACIWVKACLKERKSHLQSLINCLEVTRNCLDEILIYYNLENQYEGK